MESLLISQQRILVLNALKIVEPVKYQWKRIHRFLFVFNVHLLTFYLKTNVSKRLILLIHLRLMRAENLQICFGLIK